MALVFRTDQSTPLSNDQLDGNFKYLRDQLILKYSVADFNAENISTGLNTFAVGQTTTLALAETNAINAWTVRDLVPSYTVPSSIDKSSLVSRNSNGDITATIFNGILNGNAATATLATGSTKLQTARNINGVSFDGTANVTIVDSTKLPLSGGTLNGKVTFIGATSSSASVNFGSNSANPLFPADGDFWATSSGFYYCVSGLSYKIAPVDSPAFTGLAQAPGFFGVADQIITLSHLDAAKSTLNASINLKSNLASPIFTGTPFAPTASTSVNNNQLATTAYVTTAAANNATSLTTAYQAYTTSAVTTFSNSNNIALALKANLASPALTGVPTAPTALTTDNSTQIATTAFTAAVAAAIQQQLSAAVSALNDQISSTRPVPVGAVFYMIKPNVPYGYLEANGQVVSRVVYSALWNYLGQPNTGNGTTTFNVIDLRAEFIRGWDNGRGVDTNRVIGSAQLSDNLAHNHGSAGDDQLGWATNVAGWPGTSRGSFPYDADSKYGGGSQIWDTTTDGGNESRPRNVALMPIIKW